jgi:hypothetical protein
VGIGGASVGGLVVLGGGVVGVPPPYGGSCARYVVLGGGVDVFGGNVVIEWHDRRIRASKWKQWDIDYRFRSYNKAEAEADQQNGWGYLHY